LHLLNFSRTPTLAYHMLGWLMISAYSILTAIMVTFARLGFGLHQALSSRYTTFSLYIIVSLVNLVSVLMAGPLPREHFTRHMRVVFPLIFSTISMLVLLHLLMLNVMVDRMARVRLQRLQAKACLLFINFAQNECLTKKMYPHRELLKQRANALNSLGFLRPALIENLRVQDIESIDHPSAADYGAFEGLRKIGDSYVASGWAILPYRNEPADAILLAHEKGDGHSMVFALVEGGAQQGFTRRTWRYNRYAHSHWQTSLALDELPVTPGTLTAWAFDAQTGRAFKLQGTAVIPELE
jgi:hypothetical protein